MFTDCQIREREEAVRSPHHLLIQTQRKRIQRENLILKGQGQKKLLSSFAILIIQVSFVL